MENMNKYTESMKKIEDNRKKEEQQEKKYRETMSRINRYKNNNGSLEGIEEEILSLINDLTYSEEYSPYGRKYIPCGYEKYGEYLSFIGRHHDAFKAYQCALDAYQNDLFGWRIIKTYIFERLYTNLMREAAESGHYTEAFYYFDNLKQTISEYINKTRQAKRATPIPRGSLVEDYEWKLCLLKIYSDSYLKPFISERPLNEREKNNYERFVRTFEIIRTLEEKEETIKNINRLRARISEEIKKDKTPFVTKYQSFLSELDDKLFILKLEKISGHKIGSEVPDTQDGGSRNITSEGGVLLIK